MAMAVRLLRHHLGTPVGQLQSKTIRIRNISDDLKINMAARPTNLFVDPLAMQSIFPTARQQTTDCGQRTMDNGLRRLNLSCSLVCPPCWI